MNVDASHLQKSRETETYEKSATTVKRHYNILTSRLSEMLWRGGQML